MLLVVAGFIEKFPALVIGLMPSRRPTTIILETYNGWLIQAGVVTK